MGNRSVARLLARVLVAVVVVLGVLGVLPPPSTTGAAAATYGTVHPFGSAVDRGQPPTLNQPMVAMASTPTALGYWLLAGDGGVFAYGDASFFGSTGNLRLNRPVVGMAPTPTAKGYWFVATDGGIFAYGDAPFLGSTGDVHLNQPIVGMAATPTGRGYWLVARDGGIFAYGDAAFLGSTGGVHLNQPIVGMAATPTGRGYWLVASDGGIFAYGDAAFLGSTGDVHLNSPIVSVASTRAGDGYWLAAADGGVFAFGTAQYAGGLGGRGGAGRVVAIVRRADVDTGYWLLETGTSADRVCQPDGTLDDADAGNHPEIDLIEACLATTPGGLVFQLRARRPLSRAELVARLHPIYTATERTDSLVPRFSLSETGSRVDEYASVVFGLNDGAPAISLNDQRGFTTTTVPVQLGVANGMYTFGPIDQVFFPTRLHRFWFVASMAVRVGDERYAYDFAPNDLTAGPLYR
jgi:hypothetical protein